MWTCTAVLDVALSLPKCMHVMALSAMLFLLPEADIQSATLLTPFPSCSFALFWVPSLQALSCQKGPLPLAVVCSQSAFNMIWLWRWLFHFGWSFANSMLSNHEQGVGSQQPPDLGYTESIHRYKKLSLILPAAVLQAFYFRHTAGMFRVEGRCQGEPHWPCIWWFECSIPELAALGGLMVTYNNGMAGQDPCLGQVMWCCATHNTISRFTNLFTS